MAQIKILGNSMTIFSALKAEDLKKVIAIAPEFTKLYEQSMDTATPSLAFQVAWTEGLGSISDFGIAFDSADEKGMAYITTCINRDEGLDVGAIVESYMPAMIKLNAVEARVKEAIDGINANIKAVTEATEVIG